MLAALLIACSSPTPPTPAPADGAGSTSPGSTSPAASTSAGKARTLTVAGYSTPREAYEKAIFPAFVKSWKDKTGEDVTFEQSWQGSGAQARAVKEGFEADVVALSLDPDVALLEDAKLITHDWRAAANGGIVTRSLAVIAVRPGNPKHIADWSDLAKPDVQVLTPNVRTSGGAMWNVLAIWGSAKRGGGDPATALAGVLTRVSVMDKGARESIVNFEKGVGDAAITYENEVLLAKKEGQAMDYVVPPSTIVIENPIAVVDTYAQKHGNGDLAAAFVAFCAGPEAEAAYGEYGFRTDQPTDLPSPKDAFTIRDLGGWAAAKAEVFDKDAGYDKALAKAQPK